MATETQERTDTANKTELATKADIDELSADVAKLSTTVDKHGHELTSIRAELKWIRWTLGIIVVLLTALFGAVLAIALQI